MAKTTPWNKIKAFVKFLQEYELCLNIDEAQSNSKYFLNDFKDNIQGYYVYCLINPLNKNIFYIGKGKGKRALQHYKEYKKGVCTNNFKYNEIKSFAKYNYKPIVKVIAYNLPENKAYNLETKLIKRFYKSLTNISLNENEPNLIKREVRKIVNCLPSYEQWITGIYINKPLLFEVLKNKNFGYEIYNIAKENIIKIGKEYGICQTQKI
jgi:hypothetical protein